MICSQCGNELPEGVKSCPYCGEVIPKTQNPAPFAQQNIGQPNQGQSNYGGQNLGQQNSVGAQPQENAKKSTVKALLIAVGAIILLLGVLVWAIVRVIVSSFEEEHSYSGNRGTGESQQEVTTEEKTVTESVTKVNTFANVKSESYVSSDELEFEAEEFTWEEYFCLRSSGSYVLVPVTNNGDKTVTVRGYASIYDNSSKEIDEGTMFLEALGPGETQMGYFYFSTDSFAQIKYQLTVEESNYYEAVQKDIVFEETVFPEYVVLSATNQGDKIGRYLSAFILLFDEKDTLLNFHCDYLVDAQNEIKPGESIYSQLNFNETADHVKVFYSSYSDPYSREEDLSEIAGQLQIEKHLVNFHGEQYVLAEVTNNSNQKIGAKISFAGNDESGALISACECNFEVIGPGETVCNFAGFHCGEERLVTDVVCTGYVKSSDYYDPVVGNLTTEISKDGNYYSVILKNNGQVAAEYVEVIAILMDEKDNIIGFASSFAMDEDGELKPGATEETMVYSTVNCDHVRVGLSGRHYNQ